MSGAVHTPGPWVVRTLENFGWNIVHYVGGDKFAIARVAKVTSEADARLIAASPCLLDALKLAENFMAGFEGDELQEDVDDRLTKIRAAIARAEGGAA
ncbi:hypothetical protein J3454_14235 [Erythrobacter sp. NFXS35]|uniref:hypothetical protein n=1 Tax=Erythrobacter sp. NFXS35 TaxID=2818436 RepID=UPI0032DFCD82